MNATTVILKEARDNLSELIKRATLKRTFGIWAKRKDIKNSNSWLDDLRKKENSR